MSDQMTSIYIYGPAGSGLSDYGKKTPAEMIDQMRRHAMQKKAEAEAVLAATDSDFRVEQHLGVHLHRNVVVLQPGNKPAPKAEPETPAAGPQV